MPQRRKLVGRTSEGNALIEQLFAGQQYLLLPLHADRRLHDCPMPIALFVCKCSLLCDALLICIAHLHHQRVNRSLRMWTDEFQIDLA